MIIIYRKKDGVIVNMTQTRTVSDAEKFTLAALAQSRANKKLIDSTGNQISIPDHLGQINVDDTHQAFKYLVHMWLPGFIPRWKFLFKQNKPHKIIPINGEYPPTWNDKMWNIDNDVIMEGQGSEIENILGK